MSIVSANKGSRFWTWKFPATLALMALGFGFDLFTPLGVVDCVIYLVPVALSTRYGNRGYTFAVAAACTALTVLGLLMSPPGIGIDLAITNRVMVIAGIWLTFIVFRRMRRIEEDLETGDKFSSAVLDTVGALVVVLDPQGGIVRFNRACEKATDYAFPEVRGRLFWEFLLLPEEVGAVEEVFREIKEGDFPNTFENHWVAKNGACRLILWHNTALADDTGRVQYVIGTGVDITEIRSAAKARDELEAQVRQAQKLESLGILAGGIAHDFNNMLTAILGNADLALQDIPQSSPLRPMFEDIDTIAHRAADLCRQMLAYSGKGRFSVKFIDLSQTVRDIDRMLEASVSKKAELRFHLAVGLPSIEADEAQLRQVVMNLVINASEAIGEGGGLVTVSTYLVQCDRLYLRQAQLCEELPEGDYVCLEVSDTGCGMDRATVERIFDPFFTTKFTGRGLGLAAVLGIVRGHRGAIKAYSEPGHGTTFKALFPAASGRAEAEVPDRTGDDAWRGCGTVLLVDDEAAIRSLGSRMLERLGFEVLAAADGREALEVYDRHRGVIRCVLLDLTMPRMDGEEAFRELRERDPALPVLLCSGYNEQETVKRFVGGGLAGFIQKPYRFADVRAALKAVLDR